MKEKKILSKHELCTKGKFILKRMEEFMNFRIKEKLIVVLVAKYIIFQRRKFCRKMIFSLAWNIMFTDN